MKEIQVNSNRKVVHSGMSAMSLLGVLLVVFKLLGVAALANVSWWWITAPFWVLPAVWLGALLILLILSIIMAIVT